MKNGLTEIVLVVDRSGSMQEVKNKTISGLKEFLITQKQLPGEAVMSWMTFSSTHRMEFEGKKLSDLNESIFDDYRTDGMTALYDAVGVAIDNTGRRLAGVDESERPEKVMIVILTDGYENFSKEYTFDRIKEMIEHQKTVYSWEFLFLGADIDAMTVGGGMNITNSVNVNKFDMSNNIKKASYVASVYRTKSKAAYTANMDSRGVADVFDFSPEELDQKFEDLKNETKETK